MRRRGTGERDLGVQLDLVTGHERGRDRHLEGVGDGLADLDVAVGLATAARSSRPRWAWSARRWWRRRCRHRSWCTGTVTVDVVARLQVLAAVGVVDDGRLLGRGAGPAGSHPCRTARGRPARRRHRSGCRCPGRDVDRGRREGFADLGRAERRVAGQHQRRDRGGVRGGGRGAEERVEARHADVVTPSAAVMSGFCRGRRRRACRRPLKNTRRGPSEVNRSELLAAVNGAGIRARPGSAGSPGSRSNGNAAAAGAAATLNAAGRPSGRGSRPGVTNALQAVGRVLEPAAERGELEVRGPRRGTSRRPGADPMPRRAVLNRSNGSCVPSWTSWENADDAALRVDQRTGRSRWRTGPAGRTTTA